MLVADIERGGVFASVVGTVAPADAGRARAVPRLRRSTSFAATVTLFDEGVRILEERDRRRTASACFRTRRTSTSTPRTASRSRRVPRRRAPPGARIAIVRLAAPVERDRLPAADLGRLGDVAAARPTTTSSSCRAPRTRSPTSAGCAQAGLADWIVAQHRARRDRHRHLRRLSDARTRVSPIRRGIESDTGVRRRASGCCRSTTTLTREKRTRAVRATTAGGVTFGGYEIHLGVTTLERRRGIGRRSRRWTTAPATALCAPGVIGTYLHGALEQRRRLRGGLRRRRRPAGHASKAARLSNGSADAGSSEHGARTLEQPRVMSRHGLLVALISEDTHMNWERLLEQPTFDLRRSGRFSSPTCKEPHHVLSTSVRQRRAGRARALARQSPELRGQRPISTATRRSPRRASTAYHDRVCDEIGLPPDDTAVMGTAANMNYVAVVQRGRRGRRRSPRRSPPASRATRPRPASRRPGARPTPAWRRCPPTPARSTRCCSSTGR